jgi:hypothetical protein
MRPIGYSTGALALGDFRRGIAMLRGAGIAAVELSALRSNELLPLIAALDQLDLSGFQHVAVHAPSQFPSEDERQIVHLLSQAAEKGWPVILHPDAINDFSLWRAFGSSLYIENMDKRKPIGRTAAELQLIFDHLPEASLCFDIGHARQVDSSMTEAYFILKKFGSRLGQVHLSEVSTRSKHDRLSYASVCAFREVAAMIPEEIPIILETPVSEDQIQAEMRQALEALPVRSPELVSH